MLRCFNRFFLLLLTGGLMLAGCNRPGDVARIPTKKELGRFFKGQLQQTAKAGGYLQYKVVIDTVKQDLEATTCRLKDSSTAPCFRIMIDRTEYLSNYNQTYTTTFTDDVYHFYRDGNGKLLMLDHHPGETHTTQGGQVMQQLGD